MILGRSNIGFVDLAAFGVVGQKSSARKTEEKLPFLTGKKKCQSRRHSEWFDGIFFAWKTEEKPPGKAAIFEEGKRPKPSTFGSGWRKISARKTEKKLPFLTGRKKGQGRRHLEWFDANFLLEKRRKRCHFLTRRKKDKSRQHLEWFEGIFLLEIQERCHFWWKVIY